MVSHFQDDILQTFLGLYLRPRIQIALTNSLLRFVRFSIVGYGKDLVSKVHLIYFHFTTCLISSFP